jgi:hypothetical protein
MATLQFTVIDTFCPTSDLVVLESGMQPVGTYLTNELAQVVPANLINLGTQAVDDLAPVITDPGDIIVNADAGTCEAVVTYPNLVVTDNCSSDYPASLESFETTTWDGGNAWNAYNSTVSQVASGTNGITSSDGAFHGVLDATADSQTGAFTRLGGYSSEFGQGFVASLDVYIDLSDPAVTADTYGWDLSTAANGQDGNHQRDFIFHTASNGRRQRPCGCLQQHERHAAQRYRHAQSLRNHQQRLVHLPVGVPEAIDGSLAVDCQLLDSSGTFLWQETRNDPSDLISTEVGGNRYMWFTFLEVDSLAIDNNQLNRGSGMGAPITVTASPPSGTTFPTGTTTVTITATDACGNTAMNTFDVTVNGVSDLEVEVELLGVEAGPFTRCITFTLYDCDTSTYDVHQEDMVFTNGSTGLVTIEVPCGPWDCITAQDELHTLITTDEDDFGIAGTAFVADFTDQSGVGGDNDVLIGGNLNNDAWIDILDFGGYVGQFGVIYDGAGGTLMSAPGNPDTTCGVYIPAACRLQRRRRRGHG